jgi:hypothetical protein
LLWFQTDTTGHTWGTITSRGGRLSEPWRSNLIRFASDIRTAGFERFTVAFGPQWSNDPIGIYGPTGLIDDPWDPGKLEENWSFIKDAHGIVKGHGPAMSVFDVFSEGAISSYAENIPRLEAYTKEIWGRYTRAFGADDGTISVIGKGGPAEAADRARNLVEVLRKGGLPLPGWIEVHPDFDGPSVLAGLRALDVTLDELGVAQPFVLGEMSYENDGVAAAVAEFMRTSTRRVIELFEWPQTVEGGSCPSAPYRANAYLTTLTGAPAAPAPALRLPREPVLRAAVDVRGRATLTTARGRPVSAVDAGTYRLVIADRSRNAGFRLAGPGLGVSTGNRFTGTVTKTIELGTSAPYGSAYRWGPTPLGPSAKRVVVR